MACSEARRGHRPACERTGRSRMHDQLAMRRPREPPVGESVHRQGFGCHHGALREATEGTWRRLLLQGHQFKSDGAGKQRSTARLADQAAEVVPHHLADLRAAALVLLGEAVLDCGDEARAG
jgi:hypothetical protein